MVELVEVEPGIWRVKREPKPSARSDLALPFVISDTMPETEQVDGCFYSSKSKFRAVGRALGLTEVGTEKFKPKIRGSVLAKEQRKQSIRTAVAKYQAGHRARGG